MHPKVCSQRDTADKEQQGIQGVGDDHEHGRYGKVLFNGCHDEVEKREHPEDSHEDDIVDDGRIAFGSLRDNVSIKRKYQEGEEELCADGTCQRCGIS